MRAQLINNKKEWDDFVSKQEYSLFTQYSEYGSFYESIGEQSWVVGIYDDEKLVGGSLIVSVHARRGNFLFMPYGPILNHTQDKHLDVLVQFVRKFAKKERYDFVRVCPFIDDTLKNRKTFAKYGFRNAPLHMLAETTWLLDISVNEEELLSGMKKNHRNLIRRCIRDDVKVNKSTYTTLQQRNTTSIGSLMNI
jgi:lipid II:glycine glycyltransferase (peptidoglycan interpeptide bridge formation enzyme)